MATGYRTQRVGRRIVEALSALVERQINDPRVVGVTFTQAKVTPDLRQVKVYYSLLGGAEQVAECGRGLASAAGYLRREVTRELGLRFAPSLEFEFDASVHTADRIARLLDAAGRDDPSE